VMRCHVGVPAVVVGVAREMNPAIEMNQNLDCSGYI
jgi:hypothetical protein